mgnify:CR=1 FL=1
MESSQSITIRIYAIIHIRKDTKNAIFIGGEQYFMYEQLSKQNTSVSHEIRQLSTPVKTWKMQSLSVVCST